MGVEGAASLGIPVIVMGDVVREEATRRKLPHNPATLGRIMLELRREFGPAVIADRCIEKISRLSSPYVVIDGARSEEEINRFREAIGSVTVVAVHASPRTRFHRLLQRGRRDDASTWEAFLERDRRELNVGLGRVIAQADIMLVNEGDATELKRQVLRLLKEQFGLK